MVFKKIRVTSGVDELDKLLDELYIGDNVVWHDDAGSLADVFCLNFMQASQIEKKPLIYASFDRSPRNLIEKLGPLANNRRLIILDCFTHGKGAGSDVFLKFYDRKKLEWPCQVVKVDEPRQVNQVMDALYMGIPSNQRSISRYAMRPNNSHLKRTSIPGCKWR